MMESKKEVMHTPEPWALFRNGQSVGSADGSGVCEVWPRNEDGFPATEGMHNARRIVACVNACAGIDTEWLENNGAYAVPVPSLRTLLNQRDELLAALKELVSIANIHSEATGENFAWAELPCAISAIAKCEVQ